MTAAVTTWPASDYEVCREITRRRARNFYYGLKLTPEPKRSAMYAVYAWMRHADDLADDAAGTATDRVRRIEEYRQVTARLFRGEAPPPEPMWRAMADVIQRYELSAEPFHHMLDGQEDDLRTVKYETFEELRRFCYKVASTVGLVCIEVWGVSDPSARELAVDQGIAFQLTNILRDVRQDLEHGRCYLPMSELQAAGLTGDRLRTWSDSKACERFVAEQASRAEHHYQRSLPLIDMVSPDCRPTLWAMREIYHGLLRKILADPGSIVRAKRVRLSSLRKAWIALQARRMSKSPRLAEAQVEFCRTAMVRGAAAP
jgi:15-cis-phytoene synthase